jgi:hypothetical protein
MEPFKGHQAMEPSKGHHKMEPSIGHWVGIFLHLFPSPSFEKDEFKSFGVLFPEDNFQFKSWKYLFPWPSWREK